MNRALACSDRCHVALAQRDVVAARGHAETTLRELRDLGAPEGVGRCCLAWVELLEGNLDAAGAQLDVALHDTARREPLVRVLAEALEVALMGALGRVVEAEEALHRLEQMPGRPPGEVARVVELAAELAPAHQAFAVRCRQVAEAMWAAQPG
jgi:ATP/maltotriose-dependent transcriptional regulator MalT